ncbi:uncharacterized protein J8A68_000320 [[Candida] subhashii]|uniref:HTH APSES-type domain-containing protein n=1 Tax=[Candida] subhashii TaxID=561895 RepID=A0A8J5QWR9_9ASCO|nr:uncharacterized protein J8A68_000320 [[Candida] subhashii]KAG7666142.1 hypothetical protein J8A68_000320 [[Candida] subhashii]
MSTYSVSSISLDHMNGNFNASMPQQGIAASSTSQQQQPSPSQQQQSQQSQIPPQAYASYYMYNQQTPQSSIPQQQADYGYGRYQYSATTGGASTTSNTSAGTNPTYYQQPMQSTQAYATRNLPNQSSILDPLDAPANSTIGQFQPPGIRPRVTTTMWEDEKTLCYQVDANNVSVVRRADNNMINGTKLLNVAQMTRGRRDGILKSEKLDMLLK